jgi:Ni,Fe-hydrogenase maturation factor
MPVRIIKDYLHKAIGCETIIIGIQPQSYGFSCGLSEKIQQSVKKLSIELKDALSDD